jgi:hypothetical protein
MYQFQIAPVMENTLVVIYHSTSPVQENYHSRFISWINQYPRWTLLTSMSLKGKYPMVILDFF